MTLCIETGGVYNGPTLGDFNLPNTLTVNSCETFTYGSNLNSSQYIINIKEGLFNFGSFIENGILNVETSVRLLE